MYIMIKRNKTNYIKYIRLFHYSSNPFSQDLTSSFFKIIAPYFFPAECYSPYALRFHGVMVSTLDFESGDPSSNLGGTFTFVGAALESTLLYCTFIPEKSRVIQIFSYLPNFQDSLPRAKLLL